MLQRTEELRFWFCRDRGSRSGKRKEKEIVTKVAGHEEVEVPGEGTRVEAMGETWEDVAKGTSKQVHTLLPDVDLSMIGYFKEIVDGKTVDAK
ncbi:hypothetical protein VNO78_13083 [Psophocarpus tetragonolobus]|uniref:Uncharacterized protein n=1 Tax=Psophocarpus tetragonolobus TaxID=3891 RepID=A0AAN9SNS6_PSOTE